MTAHLTHWVAAHGLAAVFVLMAVDAILPVGGELVMLFAGAVLTSLPAAILVGALGYLAGSLIGWAIGRAGGRTFVERHGRWLHLGPDRLARAEGWLDKHGAAFVLFGRLTPVVRSFVSIPCGVLAFPFARFLALSAIASVIWCVAFGLAGHALGTHWDTVHHAFRYADYAAVLAVIALAVVLIRRNRVAS